MSTRSTPCSPKSAAHSSALPTSDDQDPRSIKLLKTNEITGVGTEPFGKHARPLRNLAEVSRPRGGDDDVVGCNLGSVVERGNESIVVTYEV